MRSALGLAHIVGFAIAAGAVAGLIAGTLISALVTCGLL